MNPMRPRFNTHGPPKTGEHRKLFPIEDLRPKQQVAKVITLAAYPGKHSTSNDMLDPKHNATALSKEALELRLRDRRIKEHGSLTWYSDFIISNRIGLHNKREYAHDYRHVAPHLIYDN